MVRRALEMHRKREAGELNAILPPEDFESEFDLASPTVQHAAGEPFTFSRRQPIDGGSVHLLRVGSPQRRACCKSALPLRGYVRIQYRF